MRKTLTAVFALGNVKKQILAALLPALVCGTQVFALSGEDYEWIQDDLTLIIKANCTLSDAVGVWQEKHAFPDSQGRIQFGQEGDGVTVTVDKSMELPGVGQIDFVGDCELIFNGLYTLSSNPDSAPYIFVGTVIPGEWRRVEASLALTFSDEAIKQALAGKDTSSKVEFELVQECMFGIDTWIEPPNSVSFKFANATAGQTYMYNDNQSYRNDGLVNPGDPLEKNTAVLYFAGSESTIGTGYQNGTFTVAFVGSNYVPVPEPATGTLSLLALAGLAARRRRK